MPPGDAMRADARAVEKAAGPLPISLTAFWELVGSVDWVGMHPSWPTGLDPLVVDPPEACLSELDDRPQILETYGHLEVFLAPDDLHKDNVSGGAPYSVRLPDPAMDFAFNFERHNLLFVPYLRLAILQYGGFPGLEGRDAALPVLASLTQGLERF